MKRAVMMKKGTASLRTQGRHEAGKRHASAAARRAERARVALHEATEGRAFATAVFRLMLATVPGEYVGAMFHCSPPPGWGAWHASDGSTMSPELMQEISKVHPGIPTLMANPGIKVIPTRGVLPPEKVLVKTPFHRLFMRPYGWRHAVALFLWQSVSPPAVDCIFCLHRTAAQGDFSAGEIARIAALHPEIDRARRRVARLAEEHGALSSLRHFVRDLPVPAVLLSWQMEPLFHNREGVECCARWQNGAATRALKPTYDLPPALLAECIAMKEEWGAHRGSRDTCGPGRRTVHHPTAPGMAASISILPLESGLISDPNFLIVFEHAGRRESKVPPAERPALAEFSRLTPRQREIAALVCEGRSNGEIAAALGCSIPTVKNGLYAIFKKTGVASRAQLMRKLVEP